MIVGVGISPIVEEWAFESHVFLEILLFAFRFWCNSNRRLRLRGNTCGRGYSSTQYRIMAGSSDITNVLAGFMVGFSLINYIVQEINAVGLEFHRHVCQY